MKEELKRLKAGLLALIMCLSLSACRNTDENNQKNKQEKTNQEEQIDDTMYIIAFVEGKAVIYEDTVTTSTIIRDAGYAKIYDNSNYIYFLQTSTIILRGKTNAISFASSIVGEENIIFMSWSDVKDGQLTLKPNN